MYTEELPVNIVIQVPSDFISLPSTYSQIRIYRFQIIERSEHLRKKNFKINRFCEFRTLSKSFGKYYIQNIIFKNFLEKTQVNKFGDKASRNKI